MSASLHSPSGRAAGVAHNMCHTRNTVELCVLCRRVSQLYTSYPSMSGFIYGGEWDALSVTQRRRITADKWIRSVTVTVASGGLTLCACVCVPRVKPASWHTKQPFLLTHASLSLVSCVCKHSSYLDLISFAPFWGKITEVPLVVRNEHEQHLTWWSSRHSVRSWALAEQPVLQPEKKRLTYSKTKSF